ncbi:hypothetical protein ILUMI_11689 [Ignelater luminosus]|uniref:Receptor-binding cancer antigen expressed on SiSo cells n=1 Tax=Ignelater luminosus TaxID=2038154 RepID=A0A8K0CVS1_IGNLU|nr:hypothetical protein ILUMI_11689 [Ignelater luminosus]
MAATVIFKKLKSFLLFIVAIWKRALCCFRRRRRASEFVPLTQIGIVTNQNIEATQENWSDWNEQIVIPTCKPSTIQEHIEFYRQQTIASRQVQDEPAEVQENFFNDMTPTITRQTKLYVNDNNDDKRCMNRLTLDPENINVMGQELGEWDEHNGWEDQTLEWDAKEALKESRKQARQKKLWEQQQRRQEKFVRPALGARVSS